MDTLTLEDKLKMFSDNIYTQLKLQKEAEINKFKSELEKEIIIEQERLQLSYEQAVVKIDRKASKLAAEIIAKEKIEKQQEILALKKEILDDLSLNVEIALIAFVNSPKYKAYLLNNINDSIEQIDDNFKIYFTKKDIDRYERDIKEILGSRNIEIKILDSKVIGGYILEDVKGKIRRDNTIKTKLSDLQEYLGLRLTELIC